MGRARQISMLKINQQVYANTIEVTWSLHKCVILMAPIFDIIYIIKFSCYCFNM